MQQLRKGLLPDVVAKGEDLEVEFRTAGRFLKLSIKDLDKPEEDGFIVNEQSLHVLDAGDVKSFLIYSERVTIESTKVLPGKELGIFCSFLRLVSPQATIDVSGRQGKNADSATTDETATAGQDGGSIWIYVENLDEDVIDRLELRASGGDGGDGFPGNQMSLDGGRGGNGGQVCVYYGGTASGKLRKTLGQVVQSKTWIEQVEKAQTQLLPKGSAKGSPLSEMRGDFPESLVQDYTQICSQYNAFATSLKLVSEAVSKIQALGPTDTLRPKPSDTSKKIVAQCSEGLLSLIKSDRPPSTAPTNADITKLQTILDATNEWYSSGGFAKEKIMQDSLTECTQLVNSVLGSEVGSTTQLWDCFQGIAYILDNANARIHSKLQHRVCSVDGGQSGQPAEDHSANKGRQGNRGTIGVRPMYFDGRLSDLDVDIVCAFPDHCQMLMNQADAYYFANEIGKASAVYSRLIQRLAFTPTLRICTTAKPLPDQPTPTPPALAKAYKRARDDWKLVILSDSEPTLQLESILKQAQSKLNRIALGQDIFAHSAKWAPRDTFQTYFKDAQESIARFQYLDNTLTKYKSATAEEVETLIKDIRDQMKNEESAEAAQTRINELTGASGILLDYLNRVRVLQQQLEGQPEAIKKDLKKVGEDIRKKLNFDPQSILDGIASFCMVPSTLFAGAEALSLSYKVVSSVQSIGGVSVPKNYVIQQLTRLGREAGGEAAHISDLTKCISKAGDGRIDVEDPGALKILATAGDIKQILAEYTDAITKADAKSLTDALENYIDAVIARNNAILAFNSALQLLEEAKASYDYYMSQIGKTGKDAISPDLSQRLPRIYSWLRKAVDDNWFTAVQSLDNAARATQFWGLVRVDCFKLLDQTYQSRSDALESVFHAIWASCRTRMTSLGNVLPAGWPSDCSGRGRFVPLTNEQLRSLKTPSGATNAKTHAVCITFRPGDFLSGQSCIRLYLVRFWLIGATVDPDNLGNKAVTVVLTHMGAESFTNEYGASYDFEHDAVSMTFKYDTRGIETIDDCIYSKDRVLLQTVMTNEYAGDKLDLTEAGVQSTNAPTHALIGPYATWYIKLRSEKDCNPGLNLSSVSAGYIEFCSISRPTI